jgi:hypothetical protein
LSIERYPISYHYYDAILNYTQNLVSTDTKEYFKFKNNFRFNFYKNENFKQKLLEKIGINEGTTDNNPGKLTFKHKIVNEKERDLINHHTSQHAKGL